MPEQGKRPGAKVRTQQIIEAAFWCSMGKVILIDAHSKEILHWKQASLRYVPAEEEGKGRAGPCPVSQVWLQSKDDD